MNEKTPISKYKEAAKEACLMHYGKMAGPLTIFFLLIYGFMIIITEAMVKFTAGMDSSGVMVLVMNIIMTVIITIATTLISVGYIYAVREMVYQRPYSIGSLFYVFKHDPDKVIIISLIFALLGVVGSIPSTIYGLIKGLNTGFDILMYVVILLATQVVVVVVSCMCALTFFIYFDHEEFSGIDCIKASCELMRGNKWRYFYMMLSFAGYIVLMMVSLFVTSYWTMPYMTAAMVFFYRDIVGDFDSNDTDFSDAIEDGVGQSFEAVVGDAE